MIQSYLQARRRLATGLILIVMLTGCYRWERTSLELQRRGARPEKLRLELTDGAQMIVEEGRVTSDSVVGAGSIGIASDRVAGLSARRLDPAITTFLGLGVLVPVVAIVGAMTTSTCGAGAAPSC
jgi:hypothetical protein